MKFRCRNRVRRTFTVLLTGATIAALTPSVAGNAVAADQTPRITASDYAPQLAAESTSRAGNVMYSGPKTINGRKAIYLTFDDGPVTRGTPEVLAALQANRVTATFFVVGGLANSRAGTNTVKRLHGAGMPIAMHSWSHPVMSGWSTAAVQRDLTVTTKAIRRATGEIPTCFRPPYGAYGRGVTNAAAARNVSVVMWDVDPRDWTDPGPSALASRVISKLHPGAIILMHDGAGHGRQAAAALPRIVRAARAKGYVFGTLCPMRRPTRSTSAMATSAAGGGS